MISVINNRGIKTEAGAVNVYIGRPSPLGNPYSLALYERSESIKLFSDEFYTLISSKKNTKNLKYKEVREILKKIYLAHKDNKHVKLICWCAPLACHGDVIKQFIEGVSS